MRLEAANNQRKMPTQRFTVKMSAGIATRRKVESLNDNERKALEPESTTQPNDSKDGCKFKSAIDEGTASADGSSADAGVQAERYRGITTGTAIQFPNGVDSSEKMIVFLMLQNEL